MSCTSTDYYAMKDREYQDQIDYQAGYDIKIEKIMDEINQELGEGDEYRHDQFWLMADEDNELRFAIGSGASYEPYRQAIIRKMAVDELHARMNDYDPD